MRTSSISILVRMGHIPCRVYPETILYTLGPNIKETSVCIVRFIWGAHHLSPRHSDAGLMNSTSHTAKESQGWHRAL